MSVKTEDSKRRGEPDVGQHRPEKMEHPGDLFVCQIERGYEA